MDKVLSPLFALREGFPGRDAVIACGKTYTCEQFDDSVYEATARLRFAGIKAHERVGIFLPNCYEYLVLLVALWHIRAVACPLNTRLPPDAAVESLKRIKCTRVVTRLDQPLAYHPSKITMQNISVIVPGIFRPSGKSPAVKLSLGDEATVLFTSGSTRAPKAVLHTIGNHYYSALGANQHIPFSSGDRWILSLPLYHVGGLGVLWRALLGGGCVVIPPDNVTLIRAIKKFNITHASLVPTQLYRMDYPAHNFTILSKLKCILLGGSAIPANLIKRAMKFNLPVYTTYGLTEMASQVAVSVKNDPYRHIILPYRELKISPNGEILVRGKTLFRGYAKGGKCSLPLDEKGWFHTGDLGTYADGRLTVTGRTDHMFISGGENIYPEEIEQCLCALEGIEDALVVPVTDKGFGFRPVAFLKIKSRGQASLERFRKLLAARLPRFKIPDEFYRWPDELSESDSLKADRKKFERFLRDKNLAL